MMNDDKFPYGLLGEGWEIAEARPAAFDGGTANARGDKDGSKATQTLFTVTGTVLVRIFGIVTTTLVGAGTLEVGIPAATAGLIAQVADATTLAAGDVWLAAASAAGPRLLSDVLGPYIVPNGATIGEKSGTADITAGQIRYICLWRPLTPDSKVVGLSE